MRHLVILLVASVAAAGSNISWKTGLPSLCRPAIGAGGACDDKEKCGSWTSWSPSNCDQCVGRQRRFRSECGNNEATAATASAAPVIEEQQRTCFSPARCTPTASREAISPAAISQSLPPLRPPEALTASFVPYLHVGAWSDCQTPGEKPNLRGGEQDRKSRKKKRRNRKRPKRNNFQPPELPPPPLPPPPPSTSPTEPGRGGSPLWSPALPADLEISFVAESVSPPQHGVQRREVVCRGQDGESLPFRYVKAQDKDKTDSKSKGKKGLSCLCIQSFY